jgi:hypothetical protein
MMKKVIFCVFVLYFTSAFSKTVTLDWQRLWPVYIENNTATNYSIKTTGSWRSPPGPGFWANRIKRLSPWWGSMQFFAHYKLVLTLTFENGVFIDHVRADTSGIYLCGSKYKGYYYYVLQAQPCGQSAIT